MGIVYKKTKCSARFATPRAPREVTPWRVDETMSKPRPGRLSLSILLVLVFLVLPASAQEGLQAGIYQAPGGEATCRLLPQDDGSWQMELWQGPSRQGPGKGFAFLGRLLAKPGGRRLGGTWMALPGSCCPGRGRGEIEVLAPDRFRFTTFAPSLDAPAWPLVPQVEFSKVADLPESPPLERLAGSWWLSMWYTDLLPGERPADLVEGRIQLEPRGQGLGGSWQGRPQPVRLEGGEQGLTLSYQDPRAGYQLSASLRPVAGGLGLAGPFHSTLGQGRLTLVRQGLPARVPGPGQGVGGDLSGTWVDPRTGNDFFDIKGSRQGFEFTAYGGSLVHPLSLSWGRPRPRGDGSLLGRARDLEGHCCGNQGRLLFKVLGPDRMEVSSFWWPLGRPDPGNPVGQPFIIQRTRGPAATPPPARPAGSRWPLVQPAQAGLMAREGGALKVGFTWQPLPQRQEPYTLFCQGGYLRDFDLFIDPRGHLAARLATARGPLELRSAQALEPNKAHQAWLVYQAPGRARLFLDGREVAGGEMAAAWTGSHSPYLVGASRWPGRTFSGDIQRVELYRDPQDPRQPGEPSLVITPPPPSPQEGEAKGTAAGAELLQLERLWHPGRLVHAYASDPQEVARLAGAGFQGQGPLGRLAGSPAEGRAALVAYRNRGRGYVILSTAPVAPAGCDSLGRLGFIWTQPGQGLRPLYQLQGVLPDPLRGGQIRDMLYTTREDTLKAARAVGYGEPRVVGYLKPAAEARFKPPVLYDWSGSWQGEGWGRFFIRRQGRELLMFWYYSRRQGPDYYGRYRLSPDGLRAQGYAVGRPGPKATYYQHTLVFDPDSVRGPVIRLTSRRLAAPLDDGRLVSFQKPRATQTLLRKTSQAIPAAETRVLQNAARRYHPRRLWLQALDRARREGRLLQR